MVQVILNLGLAFIEGFALIISPCILPILPIILSGSLEGNQKRPIGIIIGFVLSFALFTFFSREIIQLSGIDPIVIRNVALVFLLLFGIIMISSYLSEIFSRLTQRLANIGSTLTAGNPQEGFSSGLLFGGLVGLIWTPCAGPILAAVIVQTVIQKTTFTSFLTILSFGIGVALPMFIIMLGGRTIMTKFSFLKSKAIAIRKTLGIVIVTMVAILYFTNGLALTFTSEPNTKPVNIKPVSNEKSFSKTEITNGLSNPYNVPRIEGITAWINSDPLQLDQLKGKVVLIDFWAYSCVNCVRTLPYLIDWYKKYHDKGLIIIGVHSPEFDFEKDLNNVKNAVQKYGIPYPVALDNKFTTWQNYNNQYWPAEYLIDKNGRVVSQHFGEGEYDVTENNIRILLGITTPLAETIPVVEPVLSYETPETYLGYARSNQYSSPEPIEQNKTRQYTYPNTLGRDAWALRGGWNISSEKITNSKSNAAIKLHFHAGKVFAVMGNNTDKPIKVKVLLNGELVILEKGMDVNESQVAVSNHALYALVELKQPSDGILELISTEPGLEIYTFTFGN